ncbi:MAG: hypothetical protein V4725_00680 [Bacteroidota bacterium]
MYHFRKDADAVITAANSKTMNAVEKTALFAEAEIKETTPDFTNKEELPQTGQGTKPKPKAAPSRKKGKKNQ